MNETQELRRMPKGERCPECGNQKWYLQDGRRFCARGHQLEGFIQFDLGDEEDSGKQGTITRKQKVAREEEKRTLKGQAGKSLYLEALQFILRLQLSWLVKENGYREELETTVRDLWDLRIREFPDEKASQDGHLEIFSSQDVGDAGLEGVSSSSARAQSWKSERGLAWPMPGIRDTLALCYLGCCLLQIPTRIGEFQQWALSGHIPFRKAFEQIPQEMQDRMPPAYATHMKIPIREPLVPGQLHNAVLALATSFDYNYGLVFPQLNYVPILVQYARILCIPIETTIVAQTLREALSYDFSFPIKHKRVFPLQHPDIRLISLFTIAVKLCFPFDSAAVPLRVAGAPIQSSLDWSKWRPNRSTDTHESTKRIDISKVTPNDVVAMRPDDLDTYLDQVSSLIEKKNTNKIVEFFSRESHDQEDNPAPEVTDELLDKTLKKVLKAAVQISHQDDDTLEESIDTRTGYYTSFKDTSSMPATAKAFYQAAAHQSGLTLEALTRAVYMMERAIYVWQRDN
ncbi:hypothetical protein VHEMI00501 [[Torrubiella] hemipterigena]|uniref:Uncharacterized protein n=1 Tax=[Torrubiella] hemipterigena TaxID=1531966 RepID=A0A0A1SQL0_9HYPO|nr:hypothetical protein VHEMI00501 [[Torrubiella] hemipterigena]